MYSIFYADTGEYIGPMSFEEAKSCLCLFNVAQYIVNMETGEMVMEG